MHEKNRNDNLDQIKIDTQKEMEAQFKKKYSDMNVVFQTVDELVKETENKYDQIFCLVNDFGREMRTHLKSVDHKIQSFGTFVDDKMDSFDFAALPEEKFEVIEQRFAIRFE